MAAIGAAGIASTAILAQLATRRLKELDDMNRSAPYLFVVATLGLIGLGGMTVALAAPSAFSEGTRTAAAAIGASILGGLLVVLGGIPLIRVAVSKLGIAVASAILKDLVTAIALIIGAIWAIITWIHQTRQYRESLLPALEATICAHQKTLRNSQNLQNFLEYTFIEEESPARHPNVRLIEGSVYIKNVGTSKTNLQICECVRPGKDPETGDERDVFAGYCKRDAPSPTCESPGGVPKGPIVVSEVHLDPESGEMRFFQKGRFWLTRSAVDERSTKVPTDEIRPNAEDKFEFLATVPGPGIYAIMFTSPIDEAEEARMQKVDGPRPWRRRWDPTTFLEVSDSPPASDQNPAPRDCDRPSAR